jgi:hypothetical protein
MVEPFLGILPFPSIPVSVVNLLTGSVKTTLSNSMDLFRFVSISLCQ